MQFVILREEFSAPAALPALVPINLALLFTSDDSAHNSLLTQPVSCWNAWAKDDEGVALLQPCLVSSYLQNGRRRDRGQYEPHFYSPLSYNLVTCAYRCLVISSTYFIILKPPLYVRFISSKGTLWETSIR